MSDLKHGSDIVSAIQNLKRADHHFASFQASYPGSQGDKLFVQYRKKISWILTDFLSVPFFLDEIREGIRKEVNADVFALTAIQEKIPLLPIAQREFVEAIIDEILAGKELQVAGDNLETKEIEYY